MSVWRSASRCLSILIFSATAVCAFAQAPSAEYSPEVGQSGKDVVWVPSPQELVDKMLDMAKVTPKDYVIDLGSGDGRTVITNRQTFGRDLAAAVPGVTCRRHSGQGRFYDGIALRAGGVA